METTTTIDCDACGTTIANSTDTFAQFTLRTTCARCRGYEAQARAAG